MWLLTHVQILVILWQSTEPYIAITYYDKWYYMLKMIPANQLSVSQVGSSPSAQIDVYIDFSWRELDDRIWNKGHVDISLRVCSSFVWVGFLNVIH